MSLSEIFVIIGIRKPVEIDRSASGQYPSVGDAGFSRDGIIAPLERNLTGELYHGMFPFTGDDII
jgi:hypothetical protein